MIKISTYIKVFFFIFIILVSNSLFAKKAAIVMDYETKEVLFEVNADTLNFPASLTKIMTLYIVFDYIHKDKLSWETLDHRHKFRRLTQFYKIMNGLTPEYLIIPIPSLHRQLYGYGNTNILNTMFCRTDRYQNSF